MNLGLKGKKVFITGASSGIGAATAVCFAEEGCEVIIGYHHNFQAAQVILEQIRERGGNGNLCPVNIANRDSIRKAAAEIGKAHGKIDVLVSNAGKNIVTPLRKVSHEQWEEIIAINLNGPFYLLQESIPFLKEGGSIVFVSSVAGETGAPYHPHYAAAKAGIINLTKSAARELAPAIRVNCVAPGITITPMGKATLSGLDPHYAEHKLLSKRFAEPREIAKTIVFLASPAASFIYGATVDINGGRELR
jgi:3-oxoacyl-[acyl-carrier protein] reductase